MTQKEEHPEDACGRLADYLQSQQEAQIDSWLVQVRKDPGVPTGSLTDREVIDHLPSIFQAIILALRQQYDDAAQANVRELTDRHAIVRWVQSYDLPAVLRESALLRATCTRHSISFDGQRESPSSVGTGPASTVINRIFDDIAAKSTETFLKLKARAD